MSWVLVAGLLAAEPADEPKLSPPPEVAVSPPPEVAIWAQPLGLVFLAGTKSSYRLIFASVGFTVAAGDVEIATEITGWEYFERQPTPDAETTEAYAGMLAIGPVFHTGSERFCGFFVEPKVVLELGAGSYRDEFPTRRWTIASVQVGATGGWQLRWRRLYLALSLGATLGVGNQAVQANGPLFQNGLRTNNFGFAWGLDFNLLRIGVAL